MHYQISVNYTIKSDSEEKTFFSDFGPVNIDDYYDVKVFDYALIFKSIIENTNVENPEKFNLPTTEREFLDSRIWGNLGFKKSNNFKIIEINKNVLLEHAYTHGDIAEYTIDFSKNRIIESREAKIYNCLGLFDWSFVNLKDDYETEEDDDENNDYDSYDSKELAEDLAGYINACETREKAIEQIRIFISNYNNNPIEIEIYTIKTYMEVARFFDNEAEIETQLDIKTNKQQFSFVLNLDDDDTHDFIRDNYSEIYYMILRIDNEVKTRNFETLLRIIEFLNVKYEDEKIDMFSIKININYKDKNDIDSLKHYNFFNKSYRINQ